MASFTTRLGLTQPAGTEDRSVTPLNANAALIDKFMPCILVNDGVTPPTGDLYDGALVKERNSGIVWEARKNGGGTYDKIYVVYPYQILAYDNTVIAQGSSSYPTFTTRGYTSVTAAQAVNSSSADLVSNNWVAPVKGIYHFNMLATWAGNATGIRGMVPRVNAVNQTGGGGSGGDYNMNKEITPWAATDNQLEINFTRLMGGNGTVACAIYQSSGGNLNTNIRALRVTLVNPVQ